MPILTSSCGICGPGLFLEPTPNAPLKLGFTHQDISSRKHPEKLWNTKKFRAAAIPLPGQLHTEQLRRGKIQLTFTALFQAVPGNSQTSSYIFYNLEEESMTFHHRSSWAWGRSQTCVGTFKRPLREFQGFCRIFRDNFAIFVSEIHPKAKCWVLGLSFKLDLGQINEIYPKCTLI